MDNVKLTVTYQVYSDYKPEGYVQGKWNYHYNPIKYLPNNERMKTHWILT